MIKVEMDFLEDEWVPCLYCKGQRFDEKTLSILYKGKSIHDVLEMTIEQAADFFSAIPSIQRKNKALLKVGLGYMRLGQPSPTVSGGEAQMRRHGDCRRGRLLPIGLCLGDSGQGRSAIAVSCAGGAGCGG